MKKTLLTAMLLMTMLFPAIAQKTVPYSSDFYQDSDWTVIDANNDGRKWEGKYGQTNYSGAGKNCGMELRYSNSLAQDDWLVSPAITMTAGTDYTIKYWGWNGTGSGYSENYSLVCANGASLDDLKSGTTLWENDPTVRDWAQYTVSFTPEEDGDYYFAIHATSKAMQYNIRVTGFSITSNTFAPGAPSNLKVTRSSNRALAAALSWTLPTTDATGEALPSDAVFNNVTITRDEQVVATLDGTAISFIDSPDYGLTDGKHKYGVSVTVNNKRSQETTVTSAFIGTYVAELPWDYSVGQNSDLNEFWSQKHGSAAGSSASWEYYSYSGCWRCDPGVSVATDDWLFTPTINVPAAGIYRVRLNMGYYDEAATNVVLCLGQGTDIDNYTSKVTFTDIPSQGTDLYGVIEVPEAGQYNLAIHWNDSGTMSVNSLRLFSIGMEEWHATPLKATGLGVTVKGETANVFWTNPTMTDIGTTITALSKVEIYRNDELAATVTENILPGEISSYKDTPEPCVYTYKVIPYIGEYASVEDPETVSTSWVGPTVQTIPYIKEKIDSEATYTYVIENLNSDSSSWGYLSGYNMFSFPGASGEAHDNSDVLITPALEMAAGTYTCTTNIYGGLANKEIIIGLLPADYDVSIVDMTQKQTFKLNGQTYKGDPQVANFVVSEAGQYRIAFYYKSSTGADDRMICFPSISVVSNTAYPLPVSDMIVERPEDNSLKATISWSNPYQSTLDNIAPIIKEIRLLRDGEVIQTYPDYPNAAISMSYVDETIPAPGMYTYVVEVYGENGKADLPDAKVISPWIGEGADLPYEVGEGVDGVGFNTNWYHSASDIEGTNDFQYEENYLRINPEADASKVNEIAVSPFFNFESGKKYIVTLKSYNALDSSSRMFLSINTGADWEYGIYSSLQTPLETPVDANSFDTASTFNFYVSVKKDSDDTDYIPVSTTADDMETVEIPSGVYAIGFHALYSAGWTLGYMSIVDESESSVKAISNDMAFNGTLLMLPANAKNVVVTDLQGRVLSHSDDANIDMSKYNHGVYLVSAIVDGKQITSKVFVK